MDHQQTLSAFCIKKTSLTLTPMGFTLNFAATHANYLGWPIGNTDPAPSIQITGNYYFEPEPYLDLTLKVSDSLPSEVIGIELPLSLFEPLNKKTEKYTFNQKSNVAAACGQIIGNNLITYFANTTNSSSITTDSDPVADNVVVYADGSGNRKTANAPTTLAAPLTIDEGGLTILPENDSISNVTKIVPEGDYASSGTVAIQSLTGGQKGNSRIGFNGFYQTPAGETVSDPTKTRYTITHEDGPDALSIDYLYKGSPDETGKSLQIQRAAGYILEMLKGAAAPFYSIPVQLAANPGENIIWRLQGTNNNILRCGNQALTTQNYPVENGRLCWSDGTEGRFNTGQTTALGILGRPLQINHGANTASNGIKISSWVANNNPGNGRTVWSVQSTNGGSDSASVALGKALTVNSSRTWELAVDYPGNQSDEFRIVKHLGGTINPLIINGTGLSTFLGVASTRHDLIATAANPGSTNTLWLDSAALTRPSFGSAGQLALMSDLPTVTEFTTTATPVFYPWASALSSLVNARREGKYVDLYIQGRDAATTGASGIEYPAGTLPAAFRPYADMNAAYPIILNGVRTVGNITILTTGGFYILATPGSWMPGQSGTQNATIRYTIQP